MDVARAHALIDSHLESMTTVEVDAGNAHDELAETLANVGKINSALAVPGSGADLMPGFGVEDDIVDKLEKWIRRLVEKLTDIVRALGKGATFSIAVGTTVSVTVNLGPFG